MDFVEEVPAFLQCGICHCLPFESPKQCLFGHLFCENCISTWLDHEESCPLDREPLKRETLADCLLAKSLINGLKVRCSNRSKDPLPDGEGDAKKQKLEEDGVEGCAWIGPLEALETHRKECEFETITCPHGCDVRLIRRDMAAHQGQCSWAAQPCDKCGTMVRLFNKLGHATEECDMRVVKCPAGCGWSGPFRDLDLHKGTCRCQNVVCSVCNAAMIRGDMQKHLQENMIDHFQALLTKVADLNSELNTLRLHDASMTEEVQRLSQYRVEVMGQFKKLYKPRARELAPEVTAEGVWRVFTFEVPDSQRTHYSKYIGLTDVLCDECGRASVQLGFVVERVRPHEAQQDKLGRWVGVEIEKGHTPLVRGKIWLRFEVFRHAEANGQVTLTHNYNADGEPLSLDNSRGALVGEKWGFIWGRSILLTDLSYANSVGPFGSLYVKYYVRYTQD